MTKAILLSKDAGRIPSELAYMLEIHKLLTHLHKSQLKIDCLLQCTVEWQFMVVKVQKGKINMCREPFYSLITTP